MAIYIKRPAPFQPGLIVEAPGTYNFKLSRGVYSILAVGGGGAGSGNVGDPGFTCAGGGSGYAAKGRLVIEDANSDIRVVVGAGGIKTGNGADGAGSEIFKDNVSILRAEPGKGAVFISGTLRAQGGDGGSGGGSGGGFSGSSGNVGSWTTPGKGGWNGASGGAATGPGAGPGGVGAGIINISSSGLPTADTMYGMSPSQVVGTFNADTVNMVGGGTMTAAELYASSQFIYGYYDKVLLSIDPDFLHGFTLGYHGRGGIARKQTPSGTGAGSRGGGGGGMGRKPGIHDDAAWGYGAGGTTWTTNESGNGMSGFVSIINMETGIRNYALVTNPWVRVG